jgi:hypothetical protein
VIKPSSVVVVIEPAVVVVATAVVDVVTVVVDGKLPPFKTVLSASSNGNLLPQRPKKSSVSIDHTIAPANPLSMTYSA